MASTSVTHAASVDQLHPQRPPNAAVNITTTVPGSPVGLTGAPVRYCHTDVAAAAHCRAAKTYDLMTLRLHDSRSTLTFVLERTPGQVCLDHKQQVHTY